VSLSSYLSSSPTAVGDSVVFATPEGGLFLLSPGNINAPAFNDLKSTVFASLASANDTVYIHTWAPERIYALDTTGKQKWNPLDLQKK
jgi:outer membrane protein assembly factor BamB